MGRSSAQSLVGILFGSAIFGWIGDRYGRKAALIGAMFTFGIFTWVAAYASNLDEMFWLRLLAGLGIGGVIPNVIAINAESAPRRLRGTLSLVAVGFVPMGGAISGFVSATLVPHFGWPIIFLVGGIGPVVLAALAIFGLPESVKYMTLHQRQRGKLEQLLARINPGFTIPRDAQYVIEDEKQFPGFNPAYLFREGLGLITPLLWLLFALNLMGYFFLLSWTPTLLTTAHLPPQTAALAVAILQVGGTVGALLLCRWIDRHGFLVVTLLFILAVPVVGSIGFTGVSSVGALMLVSGLAGFCVLGIQSGINVLGALVYPTSLRANGSGWELGIGRVGSIVGPLLGGLFIALPVQQLYMWSAVPFALGAAICFVIYRLNEARLRQQPALREGRTVAAE